MVEKQRCYDSETCPYHKFMEQQSQDAHTEIEATKSLLRSYVMWKHFVWIVGGLCLIALLFYDIQGKQLDAMNTRLQRHSDESTKTRDVLIKLETNQAHLMRYFGLQPVDREPENDKRTERN